MKILQLRFFYNLFTIQIEKLFDIYEICEKDLKLEEITKQEKQKLLKVFKYIEKYKIDTITEQQIREFRDYINWQDLILKRKFDKNFMREFKKEFSFYSDIQNM